MNVLDLFSGIGGFSLGLERAGMRTVAFCEIEPFARKVIAKHWPCAAIYDDVRSLTADRLAADGITADVICGGFPCQDISFAGVGAGLAGERSGLWFEYARLIREIRPRYVIVENVSALLDRGMGDVLGTLASLRYDAEWHCIPASYVGAWHRRDRVWILAYPCEVECERGGKTPLLRQHHLSREFPRVDTDWPGRSNLPAPLFCRAGDGVPDFVDRVAALGNAVVPQIPEIIGRAIMNAVRS